MSLNSSSSLVSCCMGFLRVVFLFFLMGDSSSAATAGALRLPDFGVLGVAGFRGVLAGVVELPSGASVLACLSLRLILLKMTDAEPSL